MLQPPVFGDPRCASFLQKGAAFYKLVAFSGSSIPMIFTKKTASKTIHEYEYIYR